MVLMNISYDAFEHLLNGKNGRKNKTMKNAYKLIKKSGLKVLIATLAFVGLGLSAQGQKVPELLYFKFDDPSASNTIDNKAKPSTRPVEQAQIVGNPTIGGSGQFGSGLQGPTDDNNKILADWEGTLSGSFTVSWYLNNYPPGNNTSHWGTPNGNLNFHLWFNNLGWPTIRYQGNYNYFYQPNNWSFPVVIHIVYDDATQEVKYYRNGVLETTANWSNAGSIDIDDWQVGTGSTNGGGIPSGATLDEFRLYDRALTDKQVKNSWNQELFPIQNPPKANFFVPDTVYPGLVQCVANASQRENNIQWYVNGQKAGTQDTLSFNPSAVGTTQSISLTATNIEGKDSISKEVYVEAPSQPKVAFKAGKNIVDPGNKVQLFDQTKNGPTNWQWYVKPEGVLPPNYAYPNRYLSCTQVSSNSENARDPVIQFLQQGIYDVSLKASNRFGSDSLFKADYLIVRDLVDNICLRDSSQFGYGRIYDNGGDDGEYASNSRCSFTIESCGRISLQLKEFDLKPGDHLRIYDGGDTTGQPLWSKQRYGDTGLTGSLSDVPNQFISTTGAAHIVFETDFIGTADGFNLTWKTQDQQIPEPKVSFNGPDTVCPGSEVTFTNTSQNDWAAYSWDTTGLNSIGQASQKRDLKVTFPYAGTWEVALNGGNCTGIDTATKQVVVRQPVSGPSVGFTASSTTPTLGETINLSDTTVGCASYYKWEFSGDVRYVQGDSNSASPRVAFQESGCYDVTFYAGNNQDTVSVIRQCYIDVKCVPSVLNLNKDLGISRVSYGGGDNRSPVGNKGYSNYFPKGPITQVAAGETKKLVIERNTNYNDMNLKVWVDLNGDNEFGPSEMLASKQGSFTRFSTMLEIPDTSERGDLRMRIGTSLAKLPNKPCGTNDYGEYEDYQVRVTDDQTPPDIKLVGPEVLSIGACDTLPIADTSNYAIDNVDGRINNVSAVNNLDTSKGGLDTLVYRVSDNAGNTAEAYRVVSIAPDATAPNADLIGPDTTTLAVDSTYEDAGYQNAADGCSGLAEIDTVNNIPGDQLGYFSYQYLIQDNAGNQLNLDRTVRVIDTVSPEITLAANNPLKIGLNDPFNDPGIDQLTDNYWSESEIDTRIESRVNSGIRDTFEVIYTAEDGSGNVAVETRTVIVEDRQAPVLNTDLMDGDTVTVEAGRAFDVRSRLNVSDNISIGNLNLEREGAFFSILNSDGTPGALGVYDAIFRFVDQSGNSSSINLKMEVVDRTSPDISLIGDKTINLERWEETSLAASFDSGATATDNHFVNQKIVADSSSYFTDYIGEDYPSGGIHQIRYIAVDSAGNRSSITRNVNVVSNTTGIADKNADGVQLDLYPNPTDGNLRITLNGVEGSEGHLSIVNARGQKVRTLHEGQIEDGSRNIKLENQAIGVYFLRLNTQDNLVIKRFVLTK